ncbi:MAG: acylphosphatase [Paracoccaceae bacterium]
MAEERKAVRARITGRVQGVAFRWWTRRQAEALGLDGWVRNEADGSVTALIAGGAGAVDAMVRLLEDGPEAAVVIGVETEEVAVPEGPTGFRVTG